MGSLTPVSKITLPTSNSKNELGFLFYNEKEEFLVFRRLYKGRPLEDNVQISLYTSNRCLQL